MNIKDCPDKCLWKQYTVDAFLFCACTDEVPEMHFYNDHIEIEKIGCQQSEVKDGRY